MSVGGHASALALGDERGDGVFTAAADDAFELHAPREHTIGPKAELIERDAILRGPSARIDRRRDAPHGVPRVVILVDRLHLVALHAGGVDVEAERGAVVVIAVEHDAEPVGITEPHVAAAESGGDGSGIVHARADVQRLVVVEHAHLGALARPLTLARIDLREDVGDGRGGPRALVEIAVEPNGACDSRRAAHGRLHAWRDSLCAERERERECRNEKTDMHPRKISRGDPRGCTGRRSRFHVARYRSAARAASFHHHSAGAGR